MQQHIASTFTPTRKLCIFFITFLLFFKESFCGNSSYEACAPKHCPDGTKVSFPFYLQDSYCGYPGFQVQCNYNGSLLIRISDNNYFVKDINYNESSMRLVSDQDPTCPSAVANMTLNPYLFQLLHNVGPELVFLENCSIEYEVPKSLKRYRIASCGLGDHRFVMLGNDKNLGMAKEICTQAVVAPVEVRGESEVVEGGNYAEVMKRGFTVWWLAPYCDGCEMSGGRCGTLHDRDFRCFCPDGPQRYSCVNGNASRRRSFHFCNKYLIFSKKKISHLCSSIEFFNLGLI